MQGDALRQNFKPLVYVPFRQQPLRVAFFLARTNVPVDGVAQAVRARVDAVDSDVALEDLQTLKDSAASTATTWIPSTASWANMPPWHLSSL
jgi:hypothetical protein